MIVIAPHSPSPQKIRISAKAVLILLSAFVLAFCTTVLLLLMFPRLHVNEASRSRLAAENQMLRIENKNLAIGIRRLDSKMSGLEGRSAQVIALMEAN